MAGTTVSAEEKQDALVLRVRGALQLDELDPLRKSLELAWQARPARLILDCSGCPFVDTAGIAVVVGAYKRAREAGTGFYLVGLRDQFRSLLRMTRLDEIFEVRESVEAALAG